ncbi:hypothetical protein [Microcystis phage Mae-JY09]
MPLVYSRLTAIASASPAIIARALAATAFKVEGAAKRNAPVDTGNLRGSIAASGHGLRWRVTAAAEYALYVELGTRKMSAQPYLVPALRQEMPSLLKALGALV